MATFQDFGAVGDGVADDTAAVSAALNSGRVIFSDGGIYKLTSGVTVSVTSRFVGKATFLTALSFSPTEDVITVLPPSGGNIALQWDGVAFQSEGGGRLGRDLIRISIPDNTRIFSGADIRNCAFRDVNNGKSIKLDNPTAYGNGMAVCNIEGNVIYRGLDLANVGDSIWVSRNNFYGNTGDVGIFAHQVVGAQNLVVFRNSCFNTGGFMWVWRAFTPKITENVVELAGPYNGPLPSPWASLVALDGTGSTDKIKHAVIRSNNFSTVNNTGVASCLRLIHSEHVQVEENRFACNTSSQYHIARHAALQTPNLGNENFYQNSNAGYATVGARIL